MNAKAKGAHKERQSKHLLEAAGWHVEDCGYETACWVWDRALHKVYGYGHVWDGERVVHAHRAVWAHFRGPIPEGLELDHLCRNHACVKPAHLEPVSHTENCRRGAKATLRPEQLALIRSLLAEGELRHVDIAARAGVKKSRVSDISAGRRWK